MIIETLNSVYEFTADRTQIRRLKGQNDPTPRQGVDGEWKTIKSCSLPEVGLPLWIVWRIDIEDQPIFRSTITSEVTRILDCVQ